MRTPESCPGRGRARTPEAEAQRRLKIGEESRRHFASLTPQQQADQIARITELSEEQNQRRLDNLRQAVSSLPAEVRALRSQRLSDFWSNSSAEVQAARIQPMRNLSADSEEERRRKISLARKGQKRPIEEVASKSIVWGKVKPFALREGTNSEIADLTGLNLRQVTDAVHKNKSRPDWQQIEKRNDSRWNRERRRRGQLTRHYREKLSTEDIKNLSTLVMAFFEAGLITDDPSFWNEMRSIYLNNQRELPFALEERIFLEMFYQERKQADQIGVLITEQFSQAVGKVDSQWLDDYFREELKFLRTANVKHHWMLSDPNGGKVSGDCKLCGEHREFDTRVSEQKIGKNGKVQISL